MSETPEVSFYAAVEATLKAALEPREVTVNRERDSAIEPGEMPAVQIFSIDGQPAADFIGGKQMIRERLSVEMVADAAESVADALERPAAAVDAVMTLMQWCRNALLADRTLGGTVLTLEIERGTPDRLTLDTSTTTARAEALIVSAYFIR